MELSGHHVNKPGYHPRNVWFRNGDGTWSSEADVLQWYSFTDDVMVPCTGCTARGIDCDNVRPLLVGKYARKG